MISIPLCITQETSCSYLPNKRSQSAMVHPGFTMNTTLYSHLIELGFRRSGDQVYKPHCGPCQACVPTRIPVARFKPNRPQRRCMQRNRNTQVVVNTAEFNERHFDLYNQYQRARHDKSGDNQRSRQEYMHFLGSTWCDTWFVEFLIQDRLAAIAVVDVLAGGLSAVYTFFDPKFADFSPGVFAVLWQIETARSLQLDFVYLGFWIEDCRKMRYKIQYQPLQGLITNQWQDIHTPNSNEE
jgi:arginyl-tRNA--protein-N-Asp/Glu arginylyltransferase